jgi:hypothetical protein
MPIASWTSKVILGLAAAVLVVGLYGIRPAYLYFFKKPTVDQSECPGRWDAASHEDPSFKPRPEPGAVKVIRLNDLGEFVDRCEFTDAILEIGWDRFRDMKKGNDPMVTLVDPNQPSLPKFVVLYIHGWRHDGHGEDQDLIKFKDLIGRLADSNMNTRQVTGIYLAWPGKGSIPPLEMLSFWRRMRIADRIAQSAIVTKVIGAVDNVISASGDDRETVPNDAEATGPFHGLPRRGNLFVAIGHSLGARMLFAATSQSLIYGIQSSHPGVPGGTYNTINGPTDAVILLNPAFEASLYTALDAVHRWDERFPPDQLPILLSVSSSDDLVTQYAFSTAQWLAWWTAPREIKTLGNYEEFKTHSLLPSDEDRCRNGVGNMTEAYFAEGLCLHREGPAGVPFSPLVVARTSPDVIKGHSGMWKSSFPNWLFRFMDDLGKETAQRKTGTSRSP